MTKVTPNGIDAFRNKNPDYYMGPIWEWPAQRSNFRKVLHGEEDGSPRQLVGMEKKCSSFSKSRDRFSGGYAISIMVDRICRVKFNAKNAEW